MMGCFAKWETGGFSGFDWEIVPGWPGHNLKPAPCDLQTRSLNPKSKIQN
jgi:hypothetical protein